MKIEVLKTDITQLEVDAVINAANSALSGGGGVDGAIHRAAGKQLLQECLTLNRCETGQAKLTKGYNLPAGHIIHAVGPVWYGGHKDEENLLASCYRACMNIAREQEFKSLAFPAISCGAYRFPIDKAAHIAIKEIVEAGQSPTTVEHVIMACFDDNIEKALTKNLSQHLL